MPRTMQTQQGGVLTSILNTMASKQESYLEGVRTNHQVCRTVADRITTGDGLKETLLSLNKGSDDDEPLIPEKELLEFFAEQTARLKKLAETNEARQRQIQAFGNALSELQKQSSGDAETEDIDFETAIKNLMDQETKRLDAKEGDIKNSKIYKEICSALGEDEGEDDDDVAVMRNEKDNEAKCKCPLLGTWIEEPLKNPCGHAYSKEGIMQHIKSCRKGKRPCKCPFPGCNSLVEEKDLEPDAGLERIIKRLKRKVKAEEDERIQSQAMHMDDDEE